MASPALVTPNAAASKPTPIRKKLPSPTTSILNATHPNASLTATSTAASLRRKFLLLSAAAVAVLTPINPASAESDEEYVKETAGVINIVRTTIALDKNDPSVADAVSHLRDVSNSWVAKYRREKSLLGRASFRDMYSALNAVSGHYVSFGPTAPIPAKRKQRILEEMDTAEKALQRGR